MVWTSVQNLYFDDGVGLTTADVATVKLDGFEDFVHKVVLATQPALIVNFYLCYFNVLALSRLDFWVTSTILSDIQEMKLD